MPLDNTGSYGDQPGPRMATPLQDQSAVREDRANAAKVMTMLGGFDESVLERALLLVDRKLVDHTGKVLGTLVDTAYSRAPGSESLTTIKISGLVGADVDRLMVRVPTYADREHHSHAPSDAQGATGTVSSVPRPMIHYHGLPPAERAFPDMPLKEVRSQLGGR